MANLSSTRIFGDGTVERSLYVKQRLGVGVGNPSAKVQAESSGTIGESGNLSNANFLSGNTSKGIGMDDNEITQNGADLILSATSGNIEFRTNSGNERVRIESGGNVGVRTTSPSYALDVSGVIATNTELKVGSQGRLYEDGSGNTVLEEDAGGESLKIMQGNVSPLLIEAKKRLDIDFDVGGYGNVFTVDGNTNEFVRLNTNDGSAQLMNEASGPLSISSNVGIGTTSPAQKLDVQNGHINLKDGYSLGWGGSRSTQIDTNTTIDNLRFVVTGTEAMNIRGSGNVGIGTTSPASILQLGGGFDDYFVSIGDSNFGIGTENGFGGSNLDNLLLQAFNGSGRGIRFADSDNNSLAYIEADTGNVGIGTTSPDVELHVSGNTDSSVFKTTNNANVSSIVHNYGSPNPSNYQSHAGFHFNTLSWGGVGEDGSIIYDGGGSGGDPNGRLAFSTTSHLTSAESSTSSGNPNINGRVDMLIDNNGNVGIGTASPSRSLEVNGNVFINNGANGQLSIKTDDGTSKEFDINTQTGGNYGNADAHPTTNRLLFSGNSSGGVSETGSILWSGGGSGGHPNSNLYFSSTTRLQRNTDGTDNFSQADITISTGGNVGIGTYPSVKLDIEGAADLNGRLNMRGNDIDNVNQVEINGAEGSAYQVRGGANTSYGISVRAAGGNPPDDHTIFAVESGGGATRFGVTQNNGGFFRDQLWVNAGGSTDNGEIFEGEINSASPSEIALRLDGGIGFNSSGTFGDSRIEATGGDISITSSSGSAINVGSTLSINGDNGIEFDFNFEQIQFRDIGGNAAIVFKDVFSDFPSNFQIENVLEAREATIFAYEQGGNINLGWAETDGSGNVQNRANSF